mmetsp:Transcript_57670/g.165389  ORF Transcript_57670/g.165389 Transcript_57670/m.165389 type:complete len:238 (-) Transcript_57670:939-1652(-)
MLTRLLDERAITEQSFHVKHRFIVYCLRFLLLRNLGLHGHLADLGTEAEVVVLTRTCCKCMLPRLRCCRDCCIHLRHLRLVCRRRWRCWCGRCRLVVVSRLVAAHDARIQVQVHCVGICPLGSRAGAGGRRVATDVRDQLRSLRLVGAVVLGHGEAHGRLGAVVDRDEASQEGVSEDEDWAFRRRHVERHQGKGAAGCRLVHVVVGPQVENRVADLEAEIRKLVEVGAVFLRIHHSA